MNIRLVAKRSLPDGYPKDLKTLGDHLRKQRMDLGLSQSAVAKKIDVTTSTITNWELNRTEIRIRYVPKIVTFLGYNPLDVTNEDTLGARMKQWRLKHGISIKQFQSIIKMDRQTIMRIENGDTVFEKTIRRAEEFLSKNS